MISIITSLYASNKYLSKYIKNIEKFSAFLTKNKIEYEFLIISNSPNDQEKLKLKSIENNINIKSKINICNRESLYATWNRGIRNAQYPNITFWNVDDVRFPDAIMDGLSKIDTEADIVYFPFIYKRYIKILGLKILVLRKKIKMIEFNKDLFMKGMYVGPFFMVKKEAFNKIGLFDESFKIAGDFDWVVRAAKANIVFQKSDILGGIFTNDGTTLSGSKNDLQQRENNRVNGIQNMKIVATLAVKNEEWCLEHCLKSLSFVDEIIVIDDNSTDSTTNILKKYNCKIIPFESETSIGWKEYQIRRRLLEEARKEGATHIISLDADEACSEEFQKKARSIFSELESGQALELEWLNLCSSTTYKPPHIFKTFAFCDDKKSNYEYKFLGVSRVPNLQKKPLKVSGDEMILHYQFIDTERCMYKQTWYMISEFLKRDRSAARINNTYNHTKKINCKKINNKFNIPTINSSNIWQKEKIKECFNKYGIQHFEPLDIWNIQELRDIFIREIGRNPKVQKFPLWLVYANNVKNFIKNKFMK